MLQSYNVTFLRIRKCLMQDCKNARLQETPDASPSHPAVLHIGTTLLQHATLQQCNNFKMHLISIKRLLIQTTIHLITARDKMDREIV